ncbi:MAG: hypothetical protein QOE01_955 [Actinomycetota bacterium]|nr:hypothetical protein [Actinomycetota bacterium]
MPSLADHYGPPCSGQRLTRRIVSAKRIALVSGSRACDRCRSAATRSRTSAIRRARRWVGVSTGRTGAGATADVPEPDEPDDEEPEDEEPDDEEPDDEEPDDEEPEDEELLSGKRKS